MALAGRRSPSAIAMRLLLPLLVVVLVTGCATPATQPAPDAAGDAAASAARAPASAPAGASSASMEKRLGEAFIAPLVDLNLVRTPLPPALAAARQAPYATPPDLSCPALAAEIELLDAALGADLDTAATGANPGLVERGTTEATEAMIGALRNTTEGVLPFRGWVRKLTGADRYARDHTAAVAAGTVRRAFLKGLRQGSGCAAPAETRNAAGLQPE
ncbi:hypothetical protein GCM10028796_50230 [Ramlibacter monticola]|uniref:Uncharacterized protein n=1 Tax=Ramlibacter monticola TaxID=1926872 RepID=A0A937CRH6_9BURK|nr:hypothetical protein [Ramlibacter monticola]MBL0390810.1 hypothetical protein [Ramlibacter monticola]